MTLTSSDTGTVHFASPPADIPGLVMADRVDTASVAPPAPSVQEYPQSRATPFKEHLNPVLNLQPVILKVVRQWGLIIILAIWVASTTSMRGALLPAVGILFAAGLARLLIDYRVAHGAVSQRGGVTFSSIALLVAVSFAGLVGATLVSPVILIIPGLVWSIAAVAPKPWIAHLATRFAVVVTAGIAILSASRFAEAPTTIAGSIALGGAIIAAILVSSVHGRQFGPRLVENAVRVPASEGTGGSTTALEAIRDAISVQGDPIHIANTAARSIQSTFSPSYVAIVEAVPHSSMFSPLTEIVSDASSVDLGRRLVGLTEKAVSKGTPIWMLDEEDHQLAVTCRRLGIRAVLIVPLEHLSHRIGAIQIAWSEPVGPVVLADTLAYTSDVARMITPDLAIAQFASEIERGYFTAISSLAAKVDDRDEFTRGHSRRVAKHALVIAEALELDDSQQRVLLYAAELHDIGRIGVSDEILTKTGALSATEWAQIRSYPRLSADIVEPLSFFTDVREVILHQNERWDGKGYPDRLSGMDIPVLSRILAVADAFDAMTSPRAYRSAMSSQQALTELWKARGAKFDPEVVEAFVMSGSVRQKVA
jgi:hypothetical protein